MDNLFQNDIINLRSIEPEDLDLLYKWENDTSYWIFGSTITPFSKFTIKEYISSPRDIYRDNQLRFIIETKFNETIGMIDLYDVDFFHKRSAIGILIDNDYQKKGYGSSALNLIEKYTFEFLKLNQTYSFILKQNIASINLFKKQNYTNSAVLEKWVSVKNGYEDVFVMQKINNL